MTFQGTQKAACSTGSKPGFITDFLEMSGGAAYGRQDSCDEWRISIVSSKEKRNPSVQNPFFLEVQVFQAFLDWEVLGKIFQNSGISSCYAVQEKLVLRRKLRIELPGLKEIKISEAKAEAIFV